LFLLKNIDLSNILCKLYIFYIKSQWFCRKFYADSIHSQAEGVARASGRGILVRDRVTKKNTPQVRGGKNIN